MKRTLWKLLAVCVAMFVSVSSTIAYLSDTDADVNVMTLGNVGIELIELERNANGVLDDFDDDKPLFPGVYPNDEILGKEEPFWPAEVRNAVDKIVSVKNIGKSDAYVRLWFAFEVTGEEDFFRTKLHLNRNEEDWTWNELPGILEQNGERYVVATATYHHMLMPGQTTQDSLLQVLLDKTASNEDMSVLGDQYHILVVAQGMQTKGFSSPSQALDAGFGAITPDNHPFVGMETGENFVTVTASGLKKVLDNTQLGGKNAVSGVTFGRMSEYSHVVEQMASQPVAEQNNTGLLPMLITTAYADDTGNVVAYYVPGEDGKYHIYVLSEGVIKLPAECEELVGDFGNLKVFTATNLDASNVQHMQNFFKGCNNLTVVKIPEGVTVIPQEMFEDCDNLSVIEFPDSVEKVEINPQAFKDHKENVYLIVVPGSPAEQWGDAADNVTATNWPFVWWNMGDYIHIEKYIGTDANVIVPAEIDGLPVEVLGINAFAVMEHMDIVTSVQLPETLRRADYGVFIDCNNLQTINIPASLQRIPQDFLCGCNSLESIIIPEGVIKLESGAFSGCSKLVSIDLPASLTYLGYDVFAYCDQLRYINFSNGLTHIGSEAFFGTKITNLDLPGTVQWLGESAFSGMNYLQEITIPASVTSLNANCIPHRSRLTVRVPSGSAAQAYCEANALPYILIGSSAETTPKPGQTPQPTVVPDANPSDVDNYKFWSKDGYIYIDRYEDKGTPATQVTVPGWLDGMPVRVLGTDAFAAKRFLQSVTLPEGLWEIKPTAFSSCEQLTSVYLPDSVNNIGRDAFGFCAKLSGIRLPSSIDAINDSTFVGCRALTEVTIPGNVLRIEREAFANCSALQNVTMEEGVRSLAAKVFAGCSDLKSINIPKSVTSIGRSVFENCRQVVATVYENTAGHEYCVANGIPFRLLDKNGHIIAEPVLTPEPVRTPNPDPTPEASDNQFPQHFGPTNEIPFSWYKTAEYAGVTMYEGMGPDVVIPAQLGGVPVRVLGINAFARMEYIKTVQLPETLTTIEGWIFPGCEYMTTCNIPASVTYIGDGAFNGCNSLESITIPSGVPAILESTFGWCESLTTVTIPGNVKSIDSMAFHDCHGLTNVMIEDGVQSIGDQTFYNNFALTDIVIPSSVTDMGANIFKGSPCVQVTVYDRNTAYDYCRTNGIPYRLLDELGEVIEEVKPGEIPDVDFGTVFDATNEVPFTWCKMDDFNAELLRYEESYNANKDHVEVPMALMEPGTEYFYVVSSLRPDLFSGSSLKSVTVPATVTMVYEQAFANCSNLTSITFGSKDVQFA